MTNKITYKGSNIGYAMTSVIVVLYLVSRAVFRFWLPEYRPELYVWIPALFLVFAWVLSGLTFLWDKKVQSGDMLRQKTVLYFMAFKMAKLLVSVVLLLCYVEFAGTNKLAFMLTFLIYYFVFMVLEGIALRSFDQRHKPTADPVNNHR